MQRRQECVSKAVPIRVDCILLQCESKCNLLIVIILLHIWYAENTRNSELICRSALWTKPLTCSFSEVLKHLLAHSWAVHIEILPWRLECKWGTVCVTYRSKTFHVMLLQFILSFNLTRVESVCSEWSTHTLPSSSYWSWFAFVEDRNLISR
jgi:hypothetical protein